MVIALALGIGMVGYRTFEGMSWVDAFVNAAMILSGMGPVSSLQTNGGKIFAGCYALFSGLAFIAILGIIFAPVFHRFLHRFHVEEAKAHRQTAGPALILFCASRAARYAGFMLWAFTKYHGLGNDYLVIDPKNLPAPLTAAQIKTICHRHYGIGSDGILLGPLPSKKAKFAVRIFNPDGSEAEKSGNGLRIFSRYPVG